MLKPILPFYLIVSEQKALMKLSYCARYEAEDLTRKYRSIKIISARFIRTEFGIESSLQLMFSMLLLLFSQSETRTAQGLESVFDGGHDLIFGIPPTIVLVLNNIWSILSAWRAYYKVLSSTKDYFPLRSILIIGCYVILSLVIKCSACIVYFAPSLGLFNLLRHYQGELYPYWVVTHKDNFNLTDLVYYSTVKPFPWTNLTRFDYTKSGYPIEPPITIYTHCRLETILHGFYAIMLVQTLVIMAVKRALGLFYSGHFYFGHFYRAIT